MGNMLNQRKTFLLHLIAVIELFLSLLRILNAKDSCSAFPAYLLKTTIDCKAVKVYCRPILGCTLWIGGCTSAIHFLDQGYPLLIEDTPRTLPIYLVPDKLRILTKLSTRSSPALHLNTLTQAHCPPDYFT